MKDAPPPDAKVISFLELFCFFEALIRTIGRYYRARLGAVPKSCSHESLNRDVVYRSLKHYGVNLPAHTLDLLLSSDLTKRGNKSARILRNGLGHNWATEDRAEICANFDLLNGALKQAVTAIQQRVSHS